MWGAVSVYGGSTGCSKLSGNVSLQNTVAHKCHHQTLDSVLEMPPT